MIIDVRTLGIVLALIDLLLFVVLYLQYRITRVFEGPGWWVIGFGLTVLGVLLMLSRGFIDNRLICIILANAMLVLGGFMIFAGVMRFLGKTEKWILIIAYVGLLTLAFLYFTYIQESFRSRTALVSVSLALSAFLTAWVLMVHHTATFRLSALFSAWVMEAFGLVWTLRAIDVLFFTTVNTIYDQAAPHLYAFVSILVTHVLLVFGLIFMINQRLQAEVLEKKEQLEKMNTQKDKFFSIIAHDLRGPFNTLLGLTEILSDESSAESPEEMRKQAAIIKKSANSVYNLMENLLHWSRIQMNAVKLEPAILNLRKAADTELELLKEHAHRKQVRLVNLVPENCLVFADKDMLHSVMRNLLANAIKFTGHQGAISVSARALQGEVTEIAVQDTGIGMNPEMLQRLFRLNETVYRRGTEGEPSTGLGLIICKELVEKHGGRIWAASAEGTGSLFCFTMKSYKSS